jgi:tetratricopeptide (TPR) repeat protein
LSQDNKSVNFLSGPGLLNWFYFILFVLAFNLGGCSSTSTNIQIQPQSKVSESPNPEALKYFMEGQLYINQGKYAMASVELQNALLIDKNVSTIHLSLADCYWMLKKQDLSIFHMRNAIEIESENQNIKELLAKRFFALKQLDEAENVYLQLSMENPDSIKYILSLAELARLQNNLEEAISYYQKAHNVNPQELSYLETAADLALQLRNESLTIALTQKLILLNPSNLNYINKMINISLAFGNKDKTIWSMKKMLEVTGYSVEIMNQLGILYFDNSQPDSSIAVFTNVLDEEPKNQTALHYLTLIYDEMGNFLKAEEFARNLIIHYSDNPIGFSDLALLYLNHNEINKAIEILLPASKQFRSNYMIQFLTGLVLNQTDNKISAIPFYERALVLNPNSRNTMHNLSILYDSIQLWMKSDSLYKNLIATDTTDAQAYNNFAYSLVERNEQLNLALELSRKAVQLVPESAAYLDTMGWILFRIGNNTMALDYIKQSIEIENDNAIVLEHLGDVYKANNNISGAKTYWKKAFNINPGNEELEKKLSAP